MPQGRKCLGPATNLANTLAVEGMRLLRRAGWQRHRWAEADVQDALVQVARRILAVAELRGDGALLAGEGDDLVAVAAGVLADAGQNVRLVGRGEDAVDAGGAAGILNQRLAVQQQ